MKKKYLKPIPFKQVWSIDLAREISSVLRGGIYKPLLDAVEMPRQNAKKSALAEALISGRIRYAGGAFSGKISAAISKEIKAMGGKFYKGKWRLVEPQMTPEIREAVDKNKKALSGISDRLKIKFDEMAEKVSNMISNMSVEKLGVRGMDRVSDEFKATMRDKLSVSPKLKAKGVEQIGAEYIKTATKPIKKTLLKDMDETTKSASRDFAYGEIVKLREDLDKKIAAGIPRDELLGYINKRLKVGFDRAKFIAAQETRLYTTEFKKAQYQESGANTYKWQVTRDSKLRDSHKHLANEIISWDNPPIVDEKTGRRAHAGADFNCRCVPVPIVEW